MQLSIFLEIVNCDFAYTFTIDGMHRQGDRIKNLANGKFFNLKKLGGKNSIFFQFSRKGCRIFAFRLRQFRDIGGLYGTDEKNSGISFKLFHQRVPNVL